MAAAWACSQCTLVNDASADRCGVCDAARPPLASPRERSSGSAGWSCEKCTLVNLANAESCELCGAARPPPAGMWACSACSYHNANPHACEICGAARRQGEHPVPVGIPAAARPRPPKRARPPQFRLAVQHPADEVAREQAEEAVPRAGDHAVSSAPVVAGTEMTVVLQATLPCNADFRAQAISSYTKPKRQKAAVGYEKIQRTAPGASGTVRSDELEDIEELEANIGIPARELGTLFAAFAEWQEVDMPKRASMENGARDFEDCMRAAVALNAYSTQLRVTNGTKLVYTQNAENTQRQLGALNVLPKQNDNYPNPISYQIRAYCRQCGRDGIHWKTNASDIDFNDHDALDSSPATLRHTAEAGWFIDHGIVPAYRHVEWYCRLGWSSNSGLKTPLPRDQLLELEAIGDQRIAAHHDKHAGHPFEGARFMVDRSVALGMELRYRHLPRKVSMELALPLNAIVAYAAYSAYWPATSESARFRLLSRPLHAGENGLESIELLPAGKDGRLVALASAAKAHAAFHLPSAHDSVPAVVPHLARLLLPLLDGQLRTLNWALSREGRRRVDNGTGAGDSDFVSTQVVDRRFGESSLVLQLRVERVFAGVRGGILAHTVGYGKTAIMIALIYCTQRVKEGMRDRDSTTQISRSPGAAGGSSCSEASALSAGGHANSAERVPPTDTGPTHTHATLIITPANLFHQWLAEFRKFLGEGYGGLRVLPLESIADLRAITSRDVRQADVVMVASPFFLSTDYHQHFSRIVSVDKAAPAAARYAALRAYAKDLSRPSETPEGLRNGRKRKLEDAGDECADGPVILEMFDWERVIFDEFHKCVGEAERYSPAWRALHEIHARYRWGLTGTPDLTLPLRVSEMAALLHVFVAPDNRIEAQRFLDLWVRADEWDTSSIPVTSHFITVDQGPAERALYLAKKRWLDGNQDADAQLLPFCSHFDPAALNNEGNSGAAVKRLLDQQKQECLAQVAAIKELEFKLRTSDSADPRILRARLEAEQGRLERMRGTVSFLAQTIEYIAKLNAGDSHECSICLEDCLPVAVSVTRCGHVFCTECISSHLAEGSGRNRCPTCNHNLDPGDHDPIAKLSAQAPGVGVDCARYGSKIARIIAELRRIHAEDREARVLVFVQWNELLLKLEDALTHYGVLCVALRGSVADRQRTISNFAEGTQRYVMLLAMEHDDSGLNLTCSNHIFFVHPMAAEPELARACEKQALGRVRRRGQTRRVNLYRFVTTGTIEMERAQAHQAILFPDAGRAT